MHGLSNHDESMRKTTSCKEASESLCWSSLLIGQKNCFSGQSEGRSSNASGTGSVKESAQGLSRACFKLSPENPVVPMSCPSSRLTAPGSLRMAATMWFSSGKTTATLSEVKIEDRDLALKHNKISESRLLSRNINHQYYAQLETKTAANTYAKIVAIVSRNIQKSPNYFIQNNNNNNI